MIEKAIQVDVSAFIPFARTFFFSFLDLTDFLLTDSDGHGDAQN